MPNPTANAGSPVSICNGDTATLVATGGLSYHWSTNENNDTIKVHPTTTTTYNVTVTSNGCSDDASVTVTVVPTPVVNASADATICAGETFNPSMTGSNYASLQWTSSGTGSFNSNIVPSPVYTPSTADINTGSVTLYILGMPNPPCTAPGVDSVHLTITPFPNASAGPDVSICQGLSTTLTATGGDTYEWNTGQTVPSITVSPLATTNYIVTVTNGGCTKSDTVLVTVLPLPNADAGNDTIICAGTGATLKATGGVGYTWSNGVNAPIILVYPLVTTTYSVTVTGTNGCKDTDDVTVMINSNLQVFVDPTNPVICQGETVELNATSSHPCIFTWGPSAGLDVTVGPSVEASPLYSIIYTVTGTDNLGCQAQALASVTVFENPLVKILPWSAKLCKGESILLTASGAMTYYWEPPTGLSSNANPVVMASPKENTTYYVTGTDINGCKSIDSTVIEVNPVPSFSLPDSVVVCNGANYLLDAEASLPNCTYLWHNGATTSWLYASTPGTYWVQVENNGCIVYDSTEIIPCTELFIPNAFTPDGDGLNDIFKVISSGDIKEFHMYVFNRWGEQIFESTNIDVGWDGRKDGDMCPIGVYSYLIDYVGQGNVLLEQEGKKYGAVLLLR
jgi:gliding motility-associated-like protein